MIKVAIIGGKGHELPDYLTGVSEIKSDTPFGQAGPAIFGGTFNGLEVVHIARHGTDQSIPPSKINYRANLYALKQLGCGCIIATSTCGSLQEEICPGEVIILDQFIDMTKKLISGINEELKTGASNYVSITEPFSDDLRNHLIESAIVQGITVHTKGVVLSIDGQRSASRAESNLYRNWGADVINMTTAPEVILANELEIPYSALTLCTRYDSWRSGDRPGDENEINRIIKENSDKAIRIITYALKRIELPD
jgi:5'-methylthioadenosine phosphorylase